MTLLVPPMIEVHLTGVFHAAQDAPGKPVTLTYTDGTTETAPFPHDLNNLGDIGFFSVVSHVQAQRPRTP